jgi:SAM-dependent methyltransferase
MTFDFYQPQRMALLDFLNGENTAAITHHNFLGNSVQLPVSLYFRDPETFSPVEKTALDLARGRVLDIGAGAGCHSLALQARGMSVVAIDFLPEAVEVMKRRNVKEAYCADLFTFQATGFDTLLCMMNGWAIAKRLSGIPAFLANMRRLLTANGQLLCDSWDLRQITSTAQAAFLEAQRQAGRYFGELELQLEYNGEKGAAISQLLIDPDTLIQYVTQLDWSCEIVAREPAGRYLTRLKPNVRSP